MSAYQSFTHCLVFYNSSTSTNLRRFLRYFDISVDCSYSYLLRVPSCRPDTFSLAGPRYTKLCLFPDGLGYIERIALLLESPSKYKRIVTPVQIVPILLYAFRPSLECSMFHRHLPQRFPIGGETELHLIYTAITEGNGEAFAGKARALRQSSAACCGDYFVGKEEEMNEEGRTSRSEGGGESSRLDRSINTPQERG